MLGVKGTVYPVPQLTLYLFTNCRPAASSGVIASSSLYHVGSLTGPITSVRHWHGHVLGSPLCQHAPTMGGGTFPSPCIHAAPYLHFTLGLILSPSSDPIPRRLVSRIQAGEFIEMRDLIADNISLHNQLEDFHGHIWPTTPAHLRPRLREVPSLSSWVHCFCAYIAVLAPDART